MDDLQAISLTDQIVAAYINPSSGFSLLHEQAAHEMTDEQWAKLQEALEEADERTWDKR